MNDEASISFDCSNCGHTIRLAVAPKGRFVPCPVCGSQVSVPEAYQTESRTKLTFKEDKTLSERVKTCPTCGKVVPSSADLCSSCGHDWRPKPKPWERSGFWLALFALAAVLILGGVGVAGWALYKKKSAGTPPPATEPSGVDWTDPDASAEPPPPAADTVPETTGAEQPKEPGTGVNRPDRDLRRSLTEQLNRSHPMHKPGDEVALRTRAGTLLRGTLVRFETERLVLRTHGEERRVLYNELDPRARILCDQAYRDHLVDQKMNLRK